jgi:hypothetical protein
MFDIKVQRGLFPPEREEVTRGWDDELHDLGSSQNYVRILRVKENEMDWKCGTNEGD